jgi:hypothetical protein
VLPTPETATSLAEKLGEGLPDADSRRRFLDGAQQAIERANAEADTDSLAELESLLGGLISSSSCSSSSSSSSAPPSGFAAEELARAAALCQAARPRRTRQPAVSAASDSTDSPPRAGSPHPPSPPQLTEEEMKHRLSGGWTKAQVVAARSHMMRHGVRRWGKPRRGMHPDQHAALCEHVAQACLGEADPLAAVLAERSLPRGESGPAGSAAEMSIAPGKRFDAYLPGQLIKVDVVVTGGGEDEQQQTKLAVSMEPSGTVVRIVSLREVVKAAPPPSSSSSSSSQDAAARRFSARFYAPGFVGEYALRAETGAVVRFRVERHPQLVDSKLAEPSSRSGQAWRKRIGTYSHPRCALSPPSFIFFFPHLTHTSSPLPH